MASFLVWRPRTQEDAKLLLLLAAGADDVEFVERLNQKFPLSAMDIIDKVVQIAATYGKGNVAFKIIELHREEHANRLFHRALIQAALSGNLRSVRTLVNKAYEVQKGTPDMKRLLPVVAACYNNKVYSPILDELLRFFDRLGPLKGCALIRYSINDCGTDYKALLSEKKDGQFVIPVEFVQCALKIARIKESAWRVDAIRECRPEVRP